VSSSRSHRPTAGELLDRFRRLLTAAGEAREYAQQTLSASQTVSLEVHALGERQDQLSAALARLEGRLESLGNDATIRGDALTTAVSEMRDAHTRSHRELLTGLKRVHADEARQRRRLRATRGTEVYELAYEEPDPLVSVIIATHDRLTKLRELCLPSILAQEYRNFEILVIGDDAPFGRDELTRGFGGAPIRFVNLAMRGPYPDDPERQWMVAGTPPFNEGLHEARGAWLAFFSDDDEMRPNHLRVLLQGARERRLEVAYGLLQDHHLGQPLGTFPPRWGQFGFQAALMHSAMRMFELELSDADFNTPNDMGMLYRMMRAGVRFGMVDEVVADYYPSLRGQLSADQPQSPTR
jgi:hypothetical protein